MQSSSYIHLRAGEALPILTLPPFVVMVAIEGSINDEWRKELANWLVRSGCLYACVWGDNCEAVHDCIDRANNEKFEYGDIPDDKFIMTTWHDKEPLLEAIWFAATSEHPTVELRHALLVHVAATENGDALLKAYRSAREEWFSGE
jgi:hypothetical protein